MAKTFEEYMAMLRTADGASSRGVIIALLEDLNKGGKLPRTWHGLLPENLVLKADLPDLFYNIVSTSKGFTNSPYYITAITEENGMTEGSRERAVCSDAIAQLFGDIDGAYKSIIGVNAYNERKHSWALVNFKPENEPFVRL